MALAVFLAVLFVLAMGQCDRDRGRLEARQQWIAEREARESEMAKPDSELFPGLGEAYRGEAAWDGKKWVKSGQGSYRP